MDITAINFKYNTDLISLKAFTVHNNLYNNYVKKVNQINDTLARDPKYNTSNQVYSNFRELKFEYSYALSSTSLHEMYFYNITKSDSEIGPNTLKIISDNYGSFDNWVKDFTATCKACRGWTIFAYEQRTKKFNNILLDTHDNGLIINIFPLIVFDGYEHAYYIDYLSDKDAYISKFIENINWNAIENRVNLLKDFRNQ